jgi:cyclic pyranopterin phosphate synthase
MTELGGRVLLLRSWLTGLVEPPPVQQDPRSRGTQIRADLGVSKVRLTGGEPLLRRDLEVLVSLVASTPGITDVALRTNGSLLAAHAQTLRAAGLHRVTVSLDSLDPTVFAAMGATKLPLSKVFDGIAAAADAGLAPIKLNTVLRRGINEARCARLGRVHRDGGHVLRCIEYMDVGNTIGWDRSEVVTSAEVLDRIAAVHPVEPVAAARPGEVAERWRYLDGRGEIGLISSVSTPFCSTCTWARLTAVGELYTCLFAAHGRDLRRLLRGGVDDDALHAAIAAAWGARDDRYSELRGLRPWTSRSPRCPTSAADTWLWCGRRSGLRLRQPVDLCRQRAAAADPSAAATHSMA